MRSRGWRLLPGPYTYYKLSNSLFLGLNVGSIFTIYAPLDPSIYSAGGIVLALAMLLIARLYPLLMTMEWFFALSLFVEVVVLAMVLWYLMHPYGFQTALLVYIGYQITFAFGGYLLRAETLALEDDRLLSRVDTAKQIGYLLGMALSWGFYHYLEREGITLAVEKVHRLHWLLLLTELLIIALLLSSFRRR